MESSKVIGLDLGDKYTHVCVLDAVTAEVVSRTKIRTVPKDVARFFEGRATCLVVMEAGGHANWIQDKLVSLGHEVVMANPRKVRMRGATNKSDSVDAEFLARMARADRSLLYPIEPRSERVRRALDVIRSREHLVRARGGLVNHVRSIVKAHGQRLRSTATYRFHLLEEDIDPRLRPALSPLMRSLEMISEQI